MLKTKFTPANWTVAEPTNKRQFNEYIEASEKEGSQFVPIIEIIGEEGKDSYPTACLVATALKMYEELEKQYNELNEEGVHLTYLTRQKKRRIEKLLEKARGVKLTGTYEQAVGFAISVF